MNQNFRRFLPLAVLAVLVLGGALWYMMSHPAPVQAPTDTLPNAEPITISEESTYYTVDAAYPASTPLAASLGSEADARAVNILKQFVEGEIARFKKDGNFENLSHDDVQMLQLDQRKYAIGIEYTTFVGPESYSYVFQIYEDTGGAHPNTYYHTITFSKKTGAVLTLKDLFAQETEYLGTLSTLARTKLPAIIAARENVNTASVDMEYIKSGTEPNTDSFASFYLDGANLVLVFPPYQVGPYVLGRVDLTIPTSEVTGLKKEFVR